MKERLGFAAARRDEGKRLAKRRQRYREEGGGEEEEVDRGLIRDMAESDRKRKEEVTVG